MFLQVKAVLEQPNVNLDGYGTSFHLRLGLLRLLFVGEVTFLLWDAGIFFTLLLAFLPKVCRLVTSNQDL